MVKYDPALAEDFAEAASFAVYFCGSAASLSTPQLYISGLATWPRNSKLSLGWRSHFPDIPRFLTPQSLIRFSDAFTPYSTLNTTKSYGTTNLLLTSCLTGIGQRIFGATKPSTIDVSVTPASLS